MCLLQFGKNILHLFAPSGNDIWYFIVCAVFESVASIFDHFRSWKANSELVSLLVRTALFTYVLKLSISMLCLFCLVHLNLRKEPQRVCRDHEGNVNLTIGIGNMARAGHEADIKRDVHWLWLARMKTHMICRWQEGFVVAEKTTPFSVKLLNLVESNRFECENENLDVATFE